MSEILKTIILGIVQGITEFLPVSSDGHLELAKYILGDANVGQEGLMVTVILHVATALATVYVFRHDIMNLITKFFSKGDNEEKDFCWKIITSMVPAAIVGLFFEDEIESMFSQNLPLVCSMLILTGILLFIGSRAKSSNKSLTHKDAFLIGIAQAFAILPGLSRSGSTISTSVALGIDKEKATRFSFIMVLPLIFGKIIKDLLGGDLMGMDLNWVALILGFIAAFFTGVLACRAMIQVVKKSKLGYFAVYCVIIGTLGILYVNFVQ
jgi:undecaprenyl-diphosphatase